MGGRPCEKLEKIGLPGPFIAFSTPPFSSTPLNSFLARELSCHCRNNAIDACYSQCLGSIFSGEKRMKKILAIAILGVALAASGFAQATMGFGMVSGTVLDPSN